MKKLPAVLLVFVGVIVLGGSFLAPGFLPFLVEEISDKFGPSQTVGAVTVDRGADEVRIEEVANPQTKEVLAPVVGKTYRIERIGGDSDPVHVEFAYDPLALEAPELENELLLWKWHEEEGQKYWYAIESRVDTAKKVVSADLSSFSILAVRAPIAAYLTAEQVGEVHEELRKVLEAPVPEYTCGVVILVEEELNVWENGELREGESYLRPVAEREEMRDCVQNPSEKNSWSGAQASVILERATSSGDQTKDASYTLNAIVTWQRDPQESADISGILKNQEGMPMPGVRVDFTKSRYENKAYSAITDEDGKYEIDLPSGFYAIQPQMASNPKLKNCTAREVREKFYEFGELPFDLARSQAGGYRHGPWQRDLDCHCSLFYIGEEQNLPVDKSYMGSRMQGTEKHTYTGTLIKPASSGYGWEGEWELTDKRLMELGVGGTMVQGGVSVQLPNNTTTTRDQYTYRFTLTRGMTSGSQFSFIVRRSADYEQSATWHGGMGAVSGGGKSMSFDTATGGDSFTIDDAETVEWSGLGSIIEMNGKDGVVFEVGEAMATSIPQISIKRMEANQG